MNFWNKDMNRVKDFATKVWEDVFDAKADTVLWTRVGNGEDTKTIAATFRKIIGDGGYTMILTGGEINRQLDDHILHGADFGKEFVIYGIKGE